MLQQLIVKEEAHLRNIASAVHGLHMAAARVISSLWRCSLRFHDASPSY
jgi:hypothetical protein